MRDELRERLARLDPMPPGVPTKPMTTPSSRQLLEEVMSTHVEERTSNRRWLPAAAALAVVAGIAAAFALGGGNAAQPLVLSAGHDDPMAMCIQFSVEELAKAPLAFEGVVTSADGETIELDVARWFKGGDADTVVLEAPAGMEALIGGIPFEEGGSYLITAYDGTVNYCGFSGPATADLRAAFDEAFGG
ncbi:MAG: hypothetical protein J5I28_10330 [Acidimicrobiales bacterium]|jgi:hypothetical protein|nr:hypothetical protein [Acidimicrobiales bacterium]